MGGGLLAALRGRLKRGDGGADSGGACVNGAKSDTDTPHPNVNGKHHDHVDDSHGHGHGGPGSWVSFLGLSFASLGGELPDFRPPQAAAPRHVADRPPHAEDLPLHAALASPPAPAHQPARCASRPLPRPVCRSAHRSASRPRALVVVFGDLGTARSAPPPLRLPRCSARPLARPAARADTLLPRATHRRPQSPLYTYASLFQDEFGNQARAAARFRARYIPPPPPPSPPGWRPVPPMPPTPLPPLARARAARAVGGRNPRRAGLPLLGARPLLHAQISGAPPPPAADTDTPRAQPPPAPHSGAPPRVLTTRGCARRGGRCS